MIEELIKEMEEHIDSDDFYNIEEECMSKIEKADLGLDAVKQLLLFMERHPLSDFGMPGAIVHYVEKFYENGYEDLLIDSVTRRPTLHTVWMVNRIMNTGENADRYEKILNDVVTRQDIEEEIKNSAKEFIDFANS